MVAGRAEAAVRDRVRADLGLGDAVDVSGAACTVWLLVRPDGPPGRVERERRVTEPLQLR